MCRPGSRRSSANSGKDLIEVGYTGNHSLRLPIIADYNQALPNAAGATLGIQPRRPNQSFGAITWVDPAGIQHLQRPVGALRASLLAGLYLLNSFTWSKALGDSEQALETVSGYYRRQSAEHLQSERRARAVELRREVHEHHQPGYELPFGRGRKFGANWNRVSMRSWAVGKINTINTANTGTPLDVIYTPGAANDVTGRIPDYRGEAVMRPNVVANPIGRGRYDRSLLQ